MDFVQDGRFENDMMLNFGKTYVTSLTRKTIIINFN
jgi:hypothetical protein